MRRAKTGYRRRSENCGHPVNKQRAYHKQEQDRGHPQWVDRKAGYRDPFASRSLVWWELEACIRDLQIWKKEVMYCWFEEQGADENTTSHRAWWWLEHGEWGSHRFPQTFPYSWWRYFPNLMSMESALLPIKSVNINLSIWLISVQLFSSTRKHMQYFIGKFQYSLRRCRLFNVYCVIFDLQLAWLRQNFQRC